MRLTDVVRRMGRKVAFIPQDICLLSKLVQTFLSYDQPVSKMIDCQEAEALWTENLISNGSHKRVKKSQISVEISQISVKMSGIYL